MTPTMARPKMYGKGRPGARRYMSGHSSVAGVGGVGSSSPAGLRGQDALADQRQQDGVRILVELRRRRADLGVRLAQLGALGQQRLQARAVDQHAGAAPAAVADHVRRLAERRFEHAGQLPQQPVLAVVVVEHDRAVAGRGGRALP